MDKIDKLFELKKTLDSILEEMLKIKDDVEAITTCVLNKNFIDNEVSHRVIDGLQTVNALNDTCKNMYSEINLGAVLPESIQAVLELTDKAISDIELEKKLYKYKKFLCLETDDDNTKALLDAEKAKLQEILNNYNAGKEPELEMYDKFVSVISEIDSSKALNGVIELASMFKTEFLAKAFFDKLVYMPKEDEIEQLYVKESEISKPAKVSEDVAETTQESSELESANPGRDEVIEKGLVVSDSVCNKECYAKISDGEGKKVGSKSFINDMKARNSTLNVISMVKMGELNAVTPNMIAAYSDAPAEQAEFTLDYLQSKGYARKYGVEDIGEFYCISPKGSKAIQSKEVRSFLKLRGPANKLCNEILEDNLYSVLVRIAYTKFLTACPKIKDIKSTENVGREYFIKKVKLTDDDKIFVFTGMFWHNADEAGECLNLLEECCEDNYECFVVAGINRDMAKRTAEYLAEKLLLDLDKVLYYALDENLCIKYNTDEAVDFALLFKAENETDRLAENENGNDECVSEEEKAADFDTERTQETPEAEEKVHDEGLSSGTEEAAAASEETHTVIENLQERKEEVKNANIDLPNVISDVYRMISDGKTYCATTYLRSMMESDIVLEKAYNKLAYAVNAPWMRCSYSSEKIFDLYSDSDDVFSKYLMIAASIRNFFMNHTVYDYNINPLYGNIKNNAVVKECPALENAIYKICSFKEQIKKGMDFYADYRAKDRIAIDEELNRLSNEAKNWYGSFVEMKVRNHKGVKRFADTWKLIFSKDGEMALCLQIVIDKDFELAECIREYLCDNFICEGCSPEYSNLDSNKLDRFINDYWDKANKDNGNHYKTSSLMGDLRNNLTKNIEKALNTMCSWIVLAEKVGTAEDDKGAIEYAKVKKDTLSCLTEAKDKFCGGGNPLNPDELAGAAVLEDTLQEIISRLDGSYDERQQKYYYVNFLRGDNVLLNNDYLPDMRGRFVDFEELSLPNRILNHSKAELMSFEEKLENIFNNYGDDYGTGELIVRYFEDMGDTSYADRYRDSIHKSIEQAEADAEMGLRRFIENLELAQSYGKIPETRENEKEKIQKIACEWFEYAKETHNYGFFKTVLSRYEEKIDEDAKIRGAELLCELEKIESRGDITDIKQNKIKKIREMIENQNYTVVEDMLSRINSDEPDESVEIAGTDYLKKFIDEYDYNYRGVAKSNVKLSTLVSPYIHNKDAKGARRLVDNWMTNGNPLEPEKLKNLLEALGFVGVSVKKQPKIGKIDNYLVTTEKAVGRKTNYKHPISAFGSRASEEGFRVVCLFGKYYADGLIEEFKNISGTKNTLVLLDFALPLTERRRLARKTKSELGDKVFAVIDRVLLMFLVNNYDVQFINQRLTAAMMPFSYCQPYVWDSSKVMPPEMFMGRKEELEQIESPAGVNIVYGGRQLGKSALLKKAKMDIDNDESNNRAVFVEIKDLNYKQAARKIGRELHDVGILAEDIDTTDWDDLARTIKNRLNNDNLGHIPYLLLLLDEADTFIESCEEINFHPLDALKEIQSIGINRFKFVIAGLHNIVRFKRDAALSNNSVLTHLTSITIKPFNQRDARRLLEEPLYYLGLRFPKDNDNLFLVPHILASTNYFPGLIQLYCANLIEAMRKDDYAGYDQGNTPVYEVNINHIRKVLSDSSFREQTREKFEITLKLDEDDMYYIIALLMAYLYYQNANSAGEKDGFSATDIINAANEYAVKKVDCQNEETINGYMQEMLELNVLRLTANGLYLFSHQSFFQLMGSLSEVEDKLLKYMED